MEKIDYFKEFKKMGVEIKPLPENYNPDLFGKKLMSEVTKQMQVSYSSNTIMLDKKV